VGADTSRAVAELRTNLSLFCRERPPCSMRDGVLAVSAIAEPLRPRGIQTLDGATFSSIYVLEDAESAFESPHCARAVIRS
jgi:hypothetical protein